MDAAYKIIERAGPAVQKPTVPICSLASAPPAAYCSGMAHPTLLRFPRDGLSPPARAIRSWCGQARERGWALRGLSEYHRADIARLLAKSSQLLARSRRVRIRLLP
jgi:hypothetical protein